MLDVINQSPFCFFACERERLRGTRNKKQERTAEMLPNLYLFLKESILGVFKGNLFELRKNTNESFGRKN